mgnify:CR=1 FL=1
MSATILKFPDRFVSSRFQGPTLYGKPLEFYQSLLCRVEQMIVDCRRFDIEVSDEMLQAHQDAIDAVDLLSC